MPPGLGAVLAMAAGDEHTCAIQTDGQLVRFERNLEGQCSAHPGLRAVIAVAAEGWHTCTLKADGQLACFGYNREGQCDVPPGLGRASWCVSGQLVWQVLCASRLGRGRRLPPRVCRQS